MTLQQQQRRLFIKGTLAGGAVLAAAGLILPRLAMAAWPAEAFHATTLDDALTKVFGSNALEASDKVVLKAPGIAENGAVVPISINAEQLENVESISIFSEKNPRPLWPALVSSPAACPIFPPGSRWVKAAT